MISYYNSDNLQVTNTVVKHNDIEYLISNIDDSVLVPWRYNWQTHLIIGLIIAVLGAVFLEVLFPGNDNLLGPVIGVSIVLGFILKLFIAKAYSLVLQLTDNSEVVLIENIKDKKLLNKISLTIEIACIENLRSEN